VSVSNAGTYQLSTTNTISTLGTGSIVTAINVNGGLLQSVTTNFMAANMITSIPATISYVVNLSAGDTITVSITGTGLTASATDTAASISLYRIA
jgi:hypothetical protein